MFSVEKIINVETTAVVEDTETAVDEKIAPTTENGDNEVKTEE